MGYAIKGNPETDERLLEEARTLMGLFEPNLNNYGAETLLDLKATLQPILGDEDGRGDRVMDRLLIRLQQSGRCDKDMREAIGKVRAFVETTPPKSCAAIARRWNRSGLWGRCQCGRPRRPSPRHSKLRRPNPRRQPNPRRRRPRSRQPKRRKPAISVTSRATLSTIARKTESRIIARK